MEDLARYLLSFEFVRFLGIGGFGTLLYYAIYAPLTYRNKERYLVYAVIAFVPSLAVTFILHKYWTFSNTREDIVQLQIGLFFLQRLLMLVLNIGCLRVLIRKMGLHPIVAQVLAHLVLSLPSYWTMRLIFAM